MPATLPISGLSWLGELSTTSLPLASTDSQAQPLPKRVSAALVKASLKASKPPRSRSMALASAPVGLPPLFGPMMDQNRLWLEWPPPLLRTAPRMASGRLSR